MSRAPRPATEPSAAKVTATAAALEVITRLEAAHGPLVLFMSGGCCDGSSPICLRAGELEPGAGDRLLGAVGGAPLYIDAEQYARWGSPHFELDAGPPAADGFSLEGLEGVHFVARSPAPPGHCQRG